MNLLWSAPDGYAFVRFRGLLIGLVVAWLLPALIAGLALAIQWLIDTTAWGDDWLLLWATSILIAISPMLSWLGLILAAPFVAILLDRGWFGWLPALALGLAVGGLMAYLMGTTLALSFGGALMLIHRAALGQISPAAFRISGQNTPI